MNDINQLNSLALAYIGDAVYELHIRQFLLEEGGIKPYHLHDQAVTFVSAVAQASIITYLIEANLLTEEEKGIVRRGRNAKSSSVPKNVPVQAYRYSTGFEALIGYLYLKQEQSRLNEVIEYAIEHIKNKERK